MATTFADALMGAEADAICGAGYGEHSQERTNARNGCRRRDWDTRAGSISRAIPKLRQSEQGVHVHGPAGLTELQHQHIGRDECVRASVQRPDRNASLAHRANIDHHISDATLMQAVRYQSQWILLFVLRAETHCQQWRRILFLVVMWLAPNPSWTTTTTSAEIQL